MEYYLSFKQKEVYDLKNSGLSIAEIAKKLNKSHTAVSTLLRITNKKIERFKNPSHILTSINFGIRHDARIQNCLAHKGLKTLEDLINLTIVDLLGTRNLGIKSIKRIEYILSKFGLKLKDLEKK